MGVKEAGKQTEQLGTPVLLTLHFSAQGQLEMESWDKNGSVLEKDVAALCSRARDRNYT